MKAITFFGEVILLIICMPVLLISMVVYYFWDKYDNRKTAKFFKKLKDNK